MGKKAALQMGIEIEVELEKYKKYRTLLPMTDSELQSYQTPEQIGNTLDKNYMKILFGEDCFGEEDDDDCFEEEDGDLWRDKLTKIVFSDSIPEESVIRSSETAIYGDISEAKDGSVIGWVEKLDAADFEYDMEYILHIDGNGKVCAPVDSKELFYGFSEVREIEFGNAFDTSQTVNMEYMFGWCEKLSILDVSSFHTENVTGMKFMFSDCVSLQELDVSSFHTENVTDMAFIFNNCSSLQELDVSGFDTKNVTNMYCMFSDCSGLKELNVSSFDTSSVIDMRGMFYGCSGLKELNVSGFDTSRAVWMGRDV